MATFAYVPNFSSNTVSVIDTATNIVVATIPVGTQPYAVAVNSLIAMDRVYVTNNASGNVSVIDPATNTVIATVPVGTSPQGIAVTPNKAFVYVTNLASNNVSVIDASTNTVVATIPVGTSPRGVVVTPNGAFVYVANVVSNDVSVIDTATNTVVATILAPWNNPYGIAVTPNGAFVYVVDASMLGNAYVIDTATNTVVATVILAGSNNPHGITITPNGAFAYIGNTGGGTVYVVNTTTNLVVATIPTGLSPNGMSTTPDGLFVYATNPFQNNVSVISTTTNLVVTTVPVGNIPFSEGIFIGTLAVISTVTLSKSISPNTIIDGGITTLTFTIVVSSGLPLPVFSITDLLPSGLAYAGSNNVAPPFLLVQVPPVGANGTIQIDGISVPAGTYNLTFSITNVSGQLNPSCSLNPSAFTNSSSNLTLTSVTFDNVPACLVVTSIVPPHPKNKGINMGAILLGSQICVDPRRYPKGRPNSFNYFGQIFTYSHTDNRGFWCYRINRNQRYIS